MVAREWQAPLEREVCKIESWLYQGQADFRKTIKKPGRLLAVKIKSIYDTSTCLVSVARLSVMSAGFPPHAFTFARGPIPERRQDAFFFGHRRRPVWGPHRNAPREPPFKEYNPITRQWHQGSQVLHNFKPNHYFTRPIDGKRRGASGRLKDALTGKGPDVFITTSGDKRTFFRDRPQRWQWSGWPRHPAEFLDDRHDRDWRLQDDPLLNPVFGQQRKKNQLYDHRTRKFVSERKAFRDPASVWKNVQWSEKVREKRTMPLSFQDGFGLWHSRVHPDSGLFAGGRPRPPWAR